MAHPFPKCLGHELGPARKVPADIDYRVPAPVPKGTNVNVPVTPQPANAWKKLAPMDPPIEKRDLVAPVDSQLDKSAPQEASAAQHQQLHETQPGLPKLAWVMRPRTFVMELSDRKAVDLQTSTIGLG